MKKYLMTGIATVTMCTAFTSCSHDLGFEQMSQDQVDKAKYESVFINRFGQPAADQDWGYAEFARKITRTENANANEWADPNKAYGGLLVPPALRPEQIAVVKKYFQTHPNLGYEDPKWDNYFIQQVYKGHTNVPQDCATPEQYLAANGSTYIIASDHMDHLIAVDEVKGIYDHINNFNHGDCSENHTVLDNGGNANDGPFHTDKIMYMQNSTTKSFGYHNSDGSLYHTEYTGLVSYKTIMKAMGAEAKCLDDGWNRSFMGFDFEQMVGSSVYEKILDYQVEGGWNAEKWGPDGFPVKGYKTFEFEGKTYNFLNSNTNMYAADRKEDSYVQKNGSTSTDPGKANFNDRPSDDIIRDLLSKGYLPYSDTLKDWVKVGGTADGYFSDWIVTLTEAKTEKIEIPSADVRIIAEDLTTNEKGDFDFNDVVFDVIYDYKPGKSAIILQAAGGTYPLYVAGHEVHKKLGNHPTNVMINTGAGPKEDPVLIEIEAVNHGLDIVVEVEKPSGKLILETNQGRAPHKIAVKPTFKWCNERDDIEKIYNNFSEWVKNPSVSWY
jgi:hypothetical protein